MSLFRRLQDHARQTPGHTALEWPGGRLSYAELVSTVDALAAQLRDRGIRTLALAADNGPLWALSDLAALHAGLCLLPLPPFFSPAQLRYALARSSAEAVVSDTAPGFLGPLAETSFAPGRPLEALGRRLAWLQRSGSPSPVPTDVHKLTFTSGTTGEPKGVMLRWDQMQPVVEALAAAVPMTRSDRHLALMPMAVLLENLGGLYVPLWAGATAILPRSAEVGLTGSSGLDAATMVAALRAARATTAIFTPQTLQALVETLEANAAIPPALRFAAVGGAPVSPRLLQRAAALGLPVFEGYGLSECASVVCLNTPVAHRPGSVGRPLPHVGIRIAADGEVWVRGPGCAGYLGEGDAPDTEWPSGDLGRLDADGYLYLTGRRRNLFITAFGRNVAPEWVERELTLEPVIAQAAAFGEGQPWNCAVIVPATGADPAAVEAALARANACLPDYARIRRWLAAQAPFTPGNGMLTGSGRLRRNRVFEHYGAALNALYLETNAS